MRLTDESIVMRNARRKESYEIVTDWVNSFGHIECQNCHLVFHDLTPKDFTAFFYSVEWQCGSCHIERIFNDERAANAAKHWQSYGAYVANRSREEDKRRERIFVVGMFCFYLLLMLAIHFNVG